MLDNQQLLAEVNKLARKIVELEGRLSNIERTSQGKYTTISNGGYTFYDTSGNVRLMVGLQDDSTYTSTSFNGSPMQAPGTPVLSAISGAMIVEWAGDNETGGSFWPRDFSRVDVHISLTSGFTPDASSLRASFTAPTRGSAAFATAPGFTVYAKLVSVNTSGAWSVASGQASIVTV